MIVEIAFCFRDSKTASQDRRGKIFRACFAVASRNRDSLERQRLPVSCQRVVGTRAKYLPLRMSAKFSGTFPFQFDSTIAPAAPLSRRIQRNCARQSFRRAKRRIIRRVSACANRC
jgi:hypothetical protein